MDILSDLKISGRVETNTIMPFSEDYIEFGCVKLSGDIMFCATFFDLNHGLVPGTASRTIDMTIPENCTKFAIVENLGGVPLIQAYSVSTQKMIYLDYEISKPRHVYNWCVSIIASTQQPLSEENRNLVFFII